MSLVSANTPRLLPRTVLIFDLLPDLTNEDLKDLGIARLVDRKRLLKAVARDRDACAADAWGNSVS